MDAILEIAPQAQAPRRRRLRPSAVGGRYKGKYVGLIGDLGINSFQLSKTITAGEGEAVTTSDRAAQRARGSGSTTWA